MALGIWPALLKASTFPKCQSPPRASNKTLLTGSLDAVRNYGSLTLTSSLIFTIVKGPFFITGLKSLVTGNPSSSHLKSPPSSISTLSFLRFFSSHLAFTRIVIDFFCCHQGLNQDHADCNSKEDCIHCYNLLVFTLNIQLF